MSILYTATIQVFNVSDEQFLGLLQAFHYYEILDNKVEVYQTVDGIKLNERMFFVNVLFKNSPVLFPVRYLSQEIPASDIQVHLWNDSEEKAEKDDGRMSMEKFIESLDLLPKTA